MNARGAGSNQHQTLVTHVENRDDELPPDRLLPAEVRKVRSQFDTYDRIEELLSHVDFMAKLAVLLKRMSWGFVIAIGAIYGVRHMFPWVADVLIRLLKILGP